MRRGHFVVWRPLALRPDPWVRDILCNPKKIKPPHVELCSMLARLRNVSNHSAKPMRAFAIAFASSAVRHVGGAGLQKSCCLLYTSDAADDLLCVDLGGRRIIK